MKHRQTTDKQQDPAAKVRVAIKELREGHRVGRILLRKFGPRADLGKHQIEEAAKERGYTADACRKLRQFAALYNDKDMEELVALCRRHHRAFPLSLLYKLVSIENRKDRRAFQQAAIAGHWSHARLSRELRARLGRRDEDLDRKQRGRKPYIPEDITETLVQIEKMAFSFVRWQEHFSEKAKLGETERLPPAVAQKLSTAIEATRALYKSASAACKRSQQRPT